VSDANLQSHLYHGAQGMEYDPIRNFKFIVKFGKTTKSPSGKTSFLGTSLGFTSVEGFNLSTESIPYRQGGYNTTVQQIPGQTTFSPVTMQNGVILGSRQKWDWMKELFSVNVGGGSGRAAGGAAAFRSNVDVYILEHPVTTGVAHNAPVYVRMYNAWPTAVSYSPLNAGDNGFVVEQMTFVHEGFEVFWRDAL
jgi:phage tail-like protein